MAVRDTRLTGLNPLAYMGVNAGSPPNIQQYDRAPTTDDYRKFIVGDMWIDRSSTPLSVYMLVKKALNASTKVVEGTWIELASGIFASSFPTDSGTAIPVAGVLNVLGGTGVDTSGSGNTVTVTAATDVATTYTADVGSAAPTANVLTVSGTAGISTSGAGSTLTISGSGGGVSWSEVTTTSQAMVADSGYLCNNAGLVTCTLPATAAQFTTLEVVGKGAGGWAIAQNAGQTIIWDESNATTVGVGGSLASTDDYDRVRLMCTVTDTTWTLMSGKGNCLIV